MEQFQLLTEEEYRDARAKYGAEFDADMGAEAVKKILRTLDLGTGSEELREELKATRSKQRMKDITKRLAPSRCCGLRERPGVDGPRRGPGHPAGPAPAGPARLRQLRDESI